MMKPVTSTLLLVLGCLQTCIALPNNRLNANVNANVDAGTFANPSIQVRPKFRYWLPDASVNASLVAEDIAEIASVGAGGFELLNYYTYGGTLGMPVVNYSTYGFGTPAYNSVLIQILQAAKNNSLLMDYEIGSESGQGVPAEPDNPGLAWHLISSNATISSTGGNFTGVIPGYGSGTLLSVVTASILGQSAGVYQTVTGARANYSIYTIDYSSLIDITSQVGTNGAISLRFPANSSVQEYIVYAAYYQLSGVRACVAGPNPQNFIQNGSFAVDHFSPAGAAVTTDFLEQYVLINGAKELLQEVGNYIWEDSVEITAVVNWTPKLAATFESMHGYSIGKYAILLNDNNQNYVGSPSLNWFYLNTPDRGQSYIDDYRSTLTSLAGTYLEAFETWSHDYMDLQYSAQVGYNQPVDMEQLVPIVDAPEGESLGFANSVDSYRQYSGPAHLAGRRILSTELGAVLGGAYMTTFPQQLEFVKRSFSGGHNMVVLHGATYSHQYPNTTWPGFTSFQYLFSEQHSRHQPAWPQGYKSLLDSIGRNQYILQAGTPKIDLLFYNKITGQNDSFPSLYPSDDLNDAGYTYTYASPANFDLPQAVVNNGILAANGPAFRALILRDTDLLTTQGAEKIVQWAYQGLPIIISGGVPSGFVGSNSSAHAMSVATINGILGLPNVHQVPAGPLASTIASIGIQPRTKVSSTALWYNVVRQAIDGSEYLFVYNDGNTTSSGSISIATTATPYLFDTSTGAIEPVYVYNVSNGRTTIPLTLAATESTIFAFTNTSNVMSPSYHIVSSDSSILGYNFSSSCGLLAKATQNTKITTSDSKTHSISLTSPLPPSTTLLNWTLTAESWTSPSNIYDLEPIATKTNTTHFLPVLVPWYTVSTTLVNASGIGYYSTTFTVSPSYFTGHSNLGAILTLPPAIHSLSARINSHLLPDLDLFNPKSDISSYIISGENTIEVITATTLFNALVPLQNELMTSGLGSFEPFVGLPVITEPVEQGLVGDVVIEFYEGVLIS